MRRLVPLSRKTNGVLRDSLRPHHPNPAAPSTKGWKAAVKEAEIPTTKYEEELKRGLEYGLPGASSIEDRTIPTFSRGELPHFAGLNSFMKAPYSARARARRRACSLRAPHARAR